MSGKEGFVYRDLFYADDTYAGLKLNDLIYKQKRVPMRQYLLYSDRVEHRHKGQDIKQKPAKRNLPAFRDL